MAWLYEKSATWRKIVAATQRSSLVMVGFAAVAVGVPLFLGDLVQTSTNNPKQHDRLEQELRARSSVDSKMLADAQKQRLQVLFDEIKAGKGEKRYEAALNGQSLGTHSRGTTVDATSIRQQPQH